MEPPVGEASLFLYSHIHLFHLFTHLFVNVYNEPGSMEGVVRDPKMKTT